VIAPIKHPKSQIAEDRQHCLRCGKRLWLQGDKSSEDSAWGPCENDAIDIRHCDYLARRSVSSRAFAQHRPAKDEHPENLAMLTAAGVTEDLRDWWDAREAVRQDARRLLSVFQPVGPVEWVEALRAWLISGPHGDVRLLELIENMKGALDPANGVVTMGELSEYWAVLGRRAADILSEMPDYEPAGDDA
jgi:hypothetical protein